MEKHNFVSGSMPIWGADCSKNIFVSKITQILLVGTSRKEKDGSWSK